jgi:prevent-host-death family protein
VVTTVTVDEAQARFEELVGLVEAGDEIVITRDGRPIAKMVPVEQLAND